jgi:hypothetical protein
MKRKESLPDVIAHETQNCPQRACTSLESCGASFEFKAE